MCTNDYIEIVNDQTKRKSYMYSTVKVFQNFLKQNLLICDTLSLIERWGGWPHQHKTFEIRFTILQINFKNINADRQTSFMNKINKHGYDSNKII